MKSSFCGRQNSEIVNDWLSDEYHAHCSCGWEGPQRHTQEDAQADLAAHYAEKPLELK